MTSKTRQRWFSIIRRYEASSLTMRQFAKAEQLNYSTFRNYYYRLRQDLPDNDQHSFLPVLLQEPSATPLPASHAPLSVTLSESLTLTFAELPPPDYLARLLTTLRAC